MANGPAKTRGFCATLRIMRRKMRAEERTCTSTLTGRLQMASHLCHRSTRSFLHDCLDSGGEITMYLPPHADEMPLDFTAYNDEEENCIDYVRLSAFESWEGRCSKHYNRSATQGDYPGWRPAVKRSSIPKTLRVVDDAQLHVFQRRSRLVQHYGHLLVGAP